MSTDQPDTPPNKYEQALEAARDIDDRTELTNLLLSLPHVVYVDVLGEDESWRQTEIQVHFDAKHGRRTQDVIKIMERAGWGVSYVTFSRERITFENYRVDG